MKTFSGWRAVGRTMRWARQQDGVTVRRHAEHFALDRMALDLEWKRPDGYGVLVSWMSDRELVDVRAGGPVKDVYMSDWDDAAQILRVLAALDLIPAELAEECDERYGRCETCGKAVQWVDPDGPYAARWCHLQPVRPYHKPEVTELCRCDWLGDGTPEHVRSGLCREVPGA